jgi:hypothetical protein
VHGVKSTPREGLEFLLPHRTAEATAIGLDELEATCREALYD